MSQRTESALFDEQEDRVDFRPLARFVGWGLAAAIAIGLLVIAARSEVGERRMATAIGSDGPPDRWQIVIAQLVARANDAESEARRLADAMGVLSADRDKLATRVTTLERSIADLTGAISARPSPSAEPPGAKETSPAPGKAEPDPATASTPVAAAKSPATTAALPPAAAGQGTQPATSQQSAPAQSAPQAAMPPATPQSPVAARSAAPASLAAPVQQPQPRDHAGAITAVALPPLAPPDPPAPAKTNESPSGQDIPSDDGASRPSTQATLPPTLAERNVNAQPMTAREAAKQAAPRTPLGVDVGGATTLGGLRALWAKITAINPPLLSELRPVIAIRDGIKPGAVQLRLVAGPVANAEAATRLCAALIAAGVPCHMAAFDGQRLALR